MKPLLHFLLLGLALFAGDRLLGRWMAEPVRELIELDAARVRRIESDWTQRVRAVPTEAERGALIRDAVDEEILFREALALGLLHTDTVVRRRLVQNARFIGLEASDEQALFEEALELGLQESDPVVRRRLVQRMRMAVSAAAREQVPTPEELRQYHEANLERFVAPATVALSHVFFGRDGDAGYEARARAALERIRDRGTPTEAAIREGDPFLRGHAFGPRSQRELEGVFGPEFARRAMALPAGAWSGPVPSAYGVHLVWVEAAEPARQQPLEEVERRVTEAVYMRRERERLREVLDRLREHYEIRVATLDAGAS